jgi:hypothetical protein
MYNIDLNNMKKMNLQKIYRSILVCTALYAGQIAYASDTTLYLSSNDTSVDVGESVQISLSVSPSGAKVCAVEGTLEFDGITCGNITLADGLAPQHTPTCADPYFLIGVPGCVLEDRLLATIDAKTENVTNARIGLVNVEGIGEGLSIPTKTRGVDFVVKQEEAPQPVAPVVAPLQDTPSQAQPSVATDEQQETNESEEVAVVEEEREAVVETDDMVALPTDDEAQLAATVDTETPGSSSLTWVLLALVALGVLGYGGRTLLARKKA